MNLNTIAASCAALLAIVAAGLALAQQTPAPNPSPWRGCCGANPWQQGSGMMGRGMMWGGMGFMARRHQAMMSGVPAPYTSMRNPLPVTRESVDRGGKLYVQNCAGCHGPGGFGDGDVGKGLTPPPGNLAWLSQMPMSRWDGYIYWTVAEGGSAFGTAMPAFKAALSSNDIWALTAYIQAHLPAPSP